MGTPSQHDFNQLYDLMIRGDKEVVFAFIDTKNITRESLENQPRDRCSPLHTAAEYGHLDIVNCLIERGLDFRNPRERPPLFVAANNGHLSVVKSLIVDHGYDINEVDSFGQTPLFHTLQEGCFDVLKYLVERGSDVNHTLYSGSTFLHLAVNYQRTEMCEYILSHGYSDINARDAGGNTALFFAALFGNLSMIRLLVDNGADVRMGNAKNLTPFWAATCNGIVENLQYLYSHGADPDVEDINGFTPLITAAEGPRIDVVHYLTVVLNVPMNMRNSTVYSPLAASLTKENWNVAVLLLQAGCDVKGDDYTLLSQALEKRAHSKDIEAFIANVLFKPRNLVDICCFGI